MADLNFAEYVAGLVEKARKAQAIANNFTQDLGRDTFLYQRYISVSSSANQ